MDLNIKIEELPVESRIQYAKRLTELMIKDYQGYPYLKLTNYTDTLNHMRSLCMETDVIMVGGFVDDVLVAIGMIRKLRPADDPKYREWATRSGYDPDKWGYGPYALIDPDFRYHGITKKIGTLTDKLAIKNGLDGWINMILNRAPNPKKPETYREPLGYYIHRGYIHTDIPNTVASWVDIGDTEETEKTFVYVAKKVN